VVSCEIGCQLVASGKAVALVTEWAWGKNARIDIACLLHCGTTVSVLQSLVVSHLTYGSSSVGQHLA
jgi:hypothetical protein